MPKIAVTVRPMLQRDLDDADRVRRLAFGTRFGLSDPSRFAGDSELLRTRWATDASTAFVAETDGKIVGGALGMDWGSVFIVGPLFVDPGHARRGVARVLMQRMVELIDARAMKLAALFTFPESATHLRLYESFGFVPQLLVPVMSKPAARVVPRAGILFSKLSASAQQAALVGCRRLTGMIWAGLDLVREICAVARLGLGDTILLAHGDAIRGFALCHLGTGSEAGSGTLFIKFAAVRPGAAEDFARLLGSCESLALEVGAQQIVAGTNTGRAGAYRLLRAHGFRAGLVGVAMHRPDGPGYNRPEVFTIDDWR